MYWFVSEIWALSAATNAIHNISLNEENLIISKAEVNEGTTMKKLKPRARGCIFWSAT